jgi:hypothetical protein
MKEGIPRRPPVAQGVGSRRGRNIMLTVEQQRLEDARQEKFAWKKWGPYLSERQWGTVREDYSENGDAWNFFTHVD